MPNTILIVDDQSSVRQLLQEYFTEQGFRVLTATDGQNAIYMARHEPPDLILLDIMMPKMDGYQFLRQYRLERQTPVIIITAREEETDAVLGGIAGISLAVGGIGIMNIMLTTVSERTHEIGLRKAIGAKRRDILLQFLVEAMVLSLIGGLIGVFFGWGAARLMGQIQYSGLTITPVVGLDSILLATMFSMAIGLFFGIYRPPALPAFNLWKPCATNKGVVATPLKEGNSTPGSRPTVLGASIALIALNAVGLPPLTGGFAPKTN